MTSDHRGSTAYRLPATYAQEQYLSCARDGRSNHNLAIAFRCRGAFHMEALRAAVSALIERHEALRTSLSRREGRLEQVVWANRPSEVAEVDLPSWSPADSRSLARFVVKESERPFELAGSLVRATFIHGRAEDQVLVLTLHHAITDGWSSWVVLSKELPALYHERAFEQPAALPSLEVQFGDYAAWERGSPDPGAQAYWRRELAQRGHALSVYNAEASTVEPAHGVWASARLTSRHPAAMHTLAELSTALRMSLPLALTAVAVSTLIRHADDSLTIGLIRSNRDRRALRSVVGFLADFVPLRIDVSDRPELPELARRVRDATDAAEAHPMPFGAIHEAVRGHGRWSGDPLCDVLVNYRPYDLAAGTGPGSDSKLGSMTTLSVPDDPPPRLDDAYPILPAHLEFVLTPDRDGGLRSTLNGARAWISPDKVRALIQDLGNTLDRLHDHVPA